VIHRFSHQTDWLFLFLLVATVTSGILMHAFRMMDWPMATYVTYAAHLVIAVPLLAVEVPFGKWAHLLYRPLAAGLAAAADRAAATAGRPCPAGAPDAAVPVASACVVPGLPRCARPRPLLTSPVPDPVRTDPRTASILDGPTKEESE
jgi:hypothetical protein